MIPENKGFTLIELMVSVMIAGILAAIALPNILSMQDRARDATVSANARNVQIAVELYMIANNGNKPTGFTTALAFEPGLKDRMKYYRWLLGETAYADDNERKSEKSNKNKEKEKKDNKDDDSNDKSNASATNAGISTLLVNPYNKANTGASAVIAGTGTTYTTWTSANKGQVCYNLANQNSPYYIAGQGKSKTITRIMEGE